MDVIGTKNLKTFAPCYSKSPPPAGFTPPTIFLDLRLLHQQLKIGGGLALFTLSHSLPLKLALFSLFLLFIYIQIYIFSRETIIRNASKGGKQITIPHMVSESIQKNQSMKETQVCS